MSSQHFVRDDQEAPLLLAHTGHFPPEQLFQLLEWNPPVYLMEGSVNAALDHQIKVERVFCSTDYEEALKETFAHQQPLTIYPLSDPSVQTVLRWLVQEGFTEVQVLTDVAESALQLIRQAPGEIRVKVHVPGQVLYPWKEQGFAKWLPPGVELKLYPLSDEASVAAQGFDQDLQSTITGEVSLFTSRGGQVSIQVAHGIIIREAMP